jgi:hypothetical protein
MVTGCPPAGVLSADGAEHGDHPSRILVKVGVQFLFDCRIGLGEQVAFTLETS